MTAAFGQLHLLTLSTSCAASVTGDANAPALFWEHRKPESGRLWLLKRWVGRGSRHFKDEASGLVLAELRGPRCLQSRAGAQPD